LIVNKIKVKGSAIKREVVFNYIKKEQQPAREANLPENVQEPEVIPNAKSSAIPPRQNGNDKQAESQLQDLKLELHKYKNQLNSLVETHRNLKNRVEMEKSKDIQSNLNCKQS
jgi:molecular chaperone GrpE (heat shock protein)